MRKWLLLAVLLVLGASAYGLGEGPGEATWPGRVFGGDTTFNGSVTVVGDSGGARIQLDCNTAAPTYDTGEAGIDCTETATDTRSKLYFQDDDGNRSMIGHSRYSVPVVVHDAAVHATNSECISPLSLATGSVVACGAYNASVPIPSDETWIFHSATTFATQALDAATEECGFYLSYSSTPGDFHRACITPDCTRSTQQPIAISGVAAPSGTYDDYYLNSVDEAYTHNLGDVEATGGFWRVLIDEVHVCVGGTEVDKPCWDVAGDTDCDGGNCTQSGTACDTLQAATVTVEYSVYK